MNIEIRPLLEYHRPDLERLIRGFDSPGRFRVTWEDSPMETRFHAVYEALEVPLHKEWDLQEEDYERYRAMIGLGHSLGAYRQGELVGLSINEPMQWNRSFWLWEFHVAPEQQRQGIGRALMEANAEKARSLGMRILVLEAINTNTKALAFYRSLGFALEGIEISRFSNHDLEPGGEVAFFMKRRVAE